MSSLNFDVRINKSKCTYFNQLITFTLTPNKGGWLRWQRCKNYIKQKPLIGLLNRRLFLWTRKEVAEMERDTREVIKINTGGSMLVEVPPKTGRVFVGIGSLNGSVEKWDKLVRLQQEKASEKDQREAMAELCDSLTDDPTMVNVILGKARIID